MPAPRADESRHPWSDERVGRRFRARDALLCVAVCAALLVLLEGPSIERTGEEMEPGAQRSLVLAVGRPAAWVADRLPLSEAGDELTAWLSPDDDLGGEGTGFDRPVAARGGVPPVTPDAFDPAALGPPPERRELRRLLVTGDSLVQPLDVELARRLAGAGADVDREPRIGSGISNSELLDWGRLSARQAEERPDAVVMFLGANEGFPMEGPDGSTAECCGPDWAALYATRVRRMMDTYRRRGAARVYWLTLPAPRDRELGEVSRAVNAAVEAAAGAYRAQVRVLDLGALFTPGGSYRDAIEVDGREQIVREADGLHLNGTGADVAADAVLAALRRDFVVEP